MSVNVVDSLVLLLDDVAKSINSKEHFEPILLVIVFVIVKLSSEVVESKIHADYQGEHLVFDQLEIDAACLVGQLSSVVDSLLSAFLLLFFYLEADHLTQELLADHERSQVVDGDSF